MDAAGHPLADDDRLKTVPELLSAFHVGTEMRKTWNERIKTPPKPSELGPIDGVSFASTATRAQLETKQVDVKMSQDDEGTSTTLDNSSDSNEEDMSPPDYYKI